MEKWTPSKDADAVSGVVSREDIEGDNDTLGAILPHLNREGLNSSVKTTPGDS